MRVLHVVVDPHSLSVGPDARRMLREGLEGRCRGRERERRELEVLDVASAHQEDTVLVEPASLDRPVDVALRLGAMHVPSPEPLVP